MMGANPYSARWRPLRGHPRQHRGDNHREDALHFDPIMILTVLLIGCAYFCFLINASISINYIIYNIHTNDSSSSYMNIQKLTMSPINIFKGLIQFIFYSFFIGFYNPYLIFILSIDFFKVPLWMGLHGYIDVGDKWMLVTLC